jgi:hypothetical protein
MFILFLFLCTFILLLAIFSARGTILDISSLKNNPWAIFWYIQIFIVLLPVIIISALGIEKIQEISPSLLVGAEPGTEIKVSFIVLGTLILYILFFTFCLRFAGLKKLPDEITFIKSHERLIFQYAVGLTIVGTMVLTVFTALGLRHAFLSSMLASEALLDVRLYNTYKTSVPHQIQPVLFWISYLLSALAGFLYRTGRKKTGIFFLPLALLFASAPGDKAPNLYSILIWILAARIKIPHTIFSPKSVFAGVGGLIFVTSMIFLLFFRQYPDANLSDFFLYLLTRIGVGQLNGTYITFGLSNAGLPPGDYFWSLIPGASFLNKEYVNYQKVLMILSGYDFEEMGVINTYFIAEAFAIGGYTLLWLSPFIVGLTSVIIIKLLRRLLAFLICEPVAPQLSLMLFLISHDITGGFNAFPFLKGFLVLGGLLFLIFLPITLVRILVSLLLKSISSSHPPHIQPPKVR